MSNTATPLLPTPAANCTAGASQPADASAGTGGAAQPADGTVGTGGVAQPSVSTPGMIGVAQSAQDLPARLWKQTPFFTQHLAAGSRNFMLDAKADTARGALNLAYQLDAWLTLSDSDLCNGSLKELLNITDALFVTAERIPKVFDHNRRQSRVDFFAYMPSGEVIRYHPGKQSKNDAFPHRMPSDSHLFEFVVAAATGVGSALHAVPPGFLASAGAPQPGVYAVTPAHLAELSMYDVPACCGRKLLVDLSQILDRQPGMDVDITRGSTFPWWLTLASASSCSDAIKDGIFTVHVSTHNQKPVLIVDNSAGRVRVTFGRSMAVANID